MVFLCCLSQHNNIGRSRKYVCIIKGSIVFDCFYVLSIQILCRLQNVAFYCRCYHITSKKDITIISREPKCRVIKSKFLYFTVKAWKTSADIYTCVFRHLAFCFRLGSLIKARSIFGILIDNPWIKHSPSIMH
jgi:hypothetical protein